MAKTPKNFPEPKKVDVTLSSERDDSLNRKQFDGSLSKKGVCTDDVSLWTFIRNATESINFKHYSEFLDKILCSDGSNNSKYKSFTQNLPFPGVDRYNHLKVATELFLMKNCSVLDEISFDLDGEKSRYGLTCDITEEKIKSMWKKYHVDIVGSSDQDYAKLGSTLPYLAIIRNKLRSCSVTEGEVKFAQSCDGILHDKLSSPCLLELIWSYWHEEGLLIQAMNAISMRFQNKRISLKSDALANLEIGTLRPLNNLLWGYIQDEQHQLTIVRRAYEYDHHYGLKMAGKAIPAISTADSRSKFIETFHNVLVISHAFYKEDDDTTILADAFPLLNSIKELHVVLSEGAHNQYGDLPSTARQEMLIKQWLLARPEMREFLASRESVPYPQPWMGSVDAMKKLMGWGDLPTAAFSTLASTGEQLLLSIRYGNWESIIDRSSAENWARYWRPEIQSYIHAYRVVTGSDLSRSPADTTMPSVYLKQREM